VVHGHLNLSVLEGQNESEQLKTNEESGPVATAVTGNVLKIYFLLFSRKSLRNFFYLAGFNTYSYLKVSKKDFFISFLY
jgi:hypothetical protein